MSVGELSSHAGSGWFGPDVLASASARPGVGAGRDAAGRNDEGGGQAADLAASGIIPAGAARWVCSSVAIATSSASASPTYDPVGMHPSCWNWPSRSSSTQSSTSLPSAKRPMMMTVHVTLRPDAAIPCHSPCWVACQ
jgi:hypothetical protein